jgi:hypothetical protein
MLHALIISGEENKLRNFSSRSFLQANIGILRGTDASFDKWQESFMENL